MKRMGGLIDLISELCFPGRVGGGWGGAAHWNG
jgi:hypothetical protein